MAPDNRLAELKQTLYQWIDSLEPGAQCVQARQLIKAVLGAKPATELEAWEQDTIDEGLQSLAEEPTIAGQRAWRVFDQHRLQSLAEEPTIAGQEVVHQLQQTLHDLKAQKYGQAVLRCV